MQTKVRIKKIILTIIGILIFQTSFCQENYLPGYIIPLNGDTLHGFIDYQNWGSNPDKIYFKDKISDTIVSYTPFNIIQFGVLDEIYVSAKVQTEVSTDNTIYIDYDKDLKFKIKTVFLQTIIKGPKSLYYYVSNIKKKNLYIKQDTGYELLIHKKYLKDQEGKTVITENKRYLGQLSLYLQDCKTIQSKLEDMDYNTESLEKLFQFYYNCTQSGIKFQKKTEKVSTEVGVLAGLSLTSLKISGSNEFVYLVNTHFHQSVNFSTGLFLNIILPRNHEKLSIYNELSFSAYNVTSHSSTDQDNSNITRTSTFAYSYLKVINMLRYKYPIGNLFVYANAGFSNGFAISAKNHQIVESKIYDPQIDEKSKALNRSRNYEQGFVVGLGSNFKRYSCEFRYENGNGMSDYSTLNTATFKYYFLVGYTF